MPDKKLTDNEIIKAFEDCNLENATLYLWNAKTEKVVRIPTIEIFDLINRLQAIVEKCEKQLRESGINLDELLKE